jgi:hypothetical protein
MAKPRGKLIRRTRATSPVARSASDGGAEIDEPVLVDVSRSPVTGGGQAKDVMMQEAVDVSDTEDEDGDRVAQPSGSAGAMANPNLSPPEPSRDSAAPRRLPRRAENLITDSDSDSSLVRPKKKAKNPVPSSDDEGSERKREKNAAAASGVRKSGARQPIKRGGKRF